MTTTEDQEVPDGLVDLLRDFTIAVLRHKPRNLHQFAAEYFNRPLINAEQLEVVSSQPRSQIIPMYVIVNDDDVTESQMQPITKRDGNRFKRRQSVCGESYNPEEDTATDEHVVYPKTDEQRQSLTLAVGSILLFRCLDDEQMQAVIDVMFEKKVEAGYHVIEQGDDGDNFYVIQSGSYDVLQKQNNSSEMKLVHQFVNKGCFGELALMYNMPRSATIVAATDGILWAMERSAFRRIVLRSAYLKRKTYDSFLQSVPILSSLDSYERLNIADALVSRSFDSGQCLIKEGDAADGMYFIEDGEVRVTIRKSGREMEVKRLSKGMYFGEMALVENSPRSASVYVITAKVKVAFLERESFERLLGPCMNIMKRTMVTYQYSS